jgi:hypothetical protein
MHIFGVRPRYEAYTYPIPGGPVRELWMLKWQRIGAAAYPHLLPFRTPL